LFAFPRSTFETNKLGSLVLKGFEPQEVLRIAKNFLSSEEWHGAREKIDIDTLETE
jgi:hypothetical protein